MTQVRQPQNQIGRRLDVVRQRGVYTAVGYRSVGQAQREGRAYGTGSGDFWLEYDRDTMVRQSRHFYRNNGIYRGLIDTAARYVVGRGFGLRVLGDDTERNEALEVAWRRWYRTAEIRGLALGPALAAQVLREAFLCGDVGQVLRKGGHVQIIEAEQISKGRPPSSGIELDGDGRPRKYYVCPYTSRGNLSIQGRREIAADQMLFMTAPGRPSQTRGEPVLQAAFPMIHRIDDICDSEALARQMISRLVMTITREQANTIAHAESIADPNKPAAGSDGDVASRLMELDYAVIFHANPGEKIEGIDRNIPGADFEKILRTFVRLMGLPVGVPLELILLDWSQANYSQSRAVLEQAYLTFYNWQTMLEMRHYEPLFRWQLPALLADAGYAGTSDPIVTEWIRPTFPWIDQLKEAQAHGVKIDRCLTTHAHVLTALGLDREDVVADREREIRDAIARAAAIKQETGADVPWQVFCGLQSPKAETPAGLRDSAARDENLEDKQEDTDDA